MISFVVSNIFRRFVSKCSSFNICKMTVPLSQGDPNSFSNPEQCFISDIYINLEVDFKKHILKGYVDLSVERPDVKSDLILDTRDLVIHSVKNKNTSTKINYVLGEPTEKFGSKLEVKLPKRGTKKFVVRIEYETSPKSTALQWLEPEQTAGKRHPYVFSMCQTIHARSLLPCQDSPAVKATYSAAISAPYELTVLMSALRDGEEMDEDPFMKSYKFVQKVPIPSYLIALVCGELESRQIGPRSHVWSEKEFVDKAAFEFSETEEMLKTAEDLMGEYVWETYDLLVLPPSFAFGGMENPSLTFVTPTLLAGDRSLASVIAHEISHSWTGNLVTNKNFEHFWLNEGFTTFVERKIIRRMQNEAVQHFEAIGGWMELEYEVNFYGEKDDFTKLVPDLKDISPDEACTVIPYEKGHSLLSHLENLLGGSEIFEKYLREYIAEFKYKSIDTDTWKSHLYKYFADKVDILNTVDWDAWFNAPGMPPVKPQFNNSLAVKCQDLADLWLAADENDLAQFSEKDIDAFTSAQIREFLSFLLKGEPLSVKKIEKMCEAYKMKERLNSEVRFRWIRLGILARWKPSIESAIEFITEQGRLKFVKPIYSDLYAWDESRDMAISTYKAHSSKMMDAVTKSLSTVLHMSTNKE